MGEGGGQVQTVMCEKVVKDDIGIGLAPVARDDMRN